MRRIIDYMSISRFLILQNIRLPMNNFWLLVLPWIMLIFIKDSKLATMFLYYIFFMMAFMGVGVNLVRKKEELFLKFFVQNKVIFFRLICNYYFFYLAISTFYCLTYYFIVSNFILDQHVVINFWHLFIAYNIYFWVSLSLHRFNLHTQELLSFVSIGNFVCFALGYVSFPFNYFSPYSLGYLISDFPLIALVVTVISFFIGCYSILNYKVDAFSQRS